MALEDIGEGLEGPGWIAVAVGTVILAPIVLPALSRGLRPIAKGAVRGYLTLSEKTREMVAETGEQWQDLVAEARAEHEARATGGEMLLLEEAPEAAGEVSGAEEAAPPHRGRRATRTAARPPAPEPQPEMQPQAQAA